MHIAPSLYSQLSQSPNLHLLRHCHRARYAELVSPHEAAEAAADAGLAPPPPGWKLYAELESTDIERLSDGSRRTVQLAVDEFDDGLPVVTITLEAGSTSYIWAVPMWESGAQEWLRDSVSQGQIGLILSATDSSRSITLVTGANLLKRVEELLRVTEVSRTLTERAHVFHMLDAGLRLMNATVEARVSAPERTTDRRVMVAARGANAVHLMNIFVASSQAALMLLPQADQATQ